MSSVRRVAVIVNPISGHGRQRRARQARATLAAEWIEASGLVGDVRVTEGPGHAQALAAAAASAGAAVVVAWGGDGTVNEVGAALVHGSAALAIVPGGSGNGLARELDIPSDPWAALQVACDGVERVIDAGEIDGRLFFNVAGVGVDARIAARFAAGGGGRRGLRRYIGATASELASFVPEGIRIVVGEATLAGRPMIAAFANSRQYGNGALIAPAARLDDGRLDLVFIEHRSLIASVWALPRLFNGSIAEASGVRTCTLTEAEVRAERPIAFHADGEPHLGGVTVRVRAIPEALRVKTPGYSAKR